MRDEDSSSREREPYEAPTITALGKLGDMTQGLEGSVVDGGTTTSAG